MNDLATRTGLPEALQILLREYPRDLWENHSHFDGLTRFWLERHLMFRKMLTIIQDDIQAGLDKKLEQMSINHRVGRIGSNFVQNLHGHHHMEDAHFFPKFIMVEPQLHAGFEILDKDHHTLDDNIDRFVTLANGLFQTETTSAHYEALGPLEHHLSQFTFFLDRHLTDEEELIVPIILKHGPEPFDHA